VNDAIIIVASFLSPFFKVADLTNRLIEPALTFIPIPLDQAFDPIYYQTESDLVKISHQSQSSSSMDEEDSNGVSLDSEADIVPSEESVKARGGRRSIQPPKRYATAEFLPEPKRAKIATKASLDKDM
jgi:hypothetical protein